MIDYLNIGLLEAGVSGDVETPVYPLADYGLALVDFTAPPPQLRTYRVNVEGRNGSIDMTEWAGETFYNDRTVTVSLRGIGTRANEFINRILGRRCRIHIDALDMRGWYFEGRCDAIEPTSEKNHETLRIVTTLAMTFTCHPFRYPAIGAQEEYHPSNSGMAYSGRRQFTLTCAAGQAATTATVSKTVFQAEETPAAIVISGWDGLTTGNKLTVNGTDYSITANGAMTAAVTLHPGANTFVLTNNINGGALDAEISFMDRVI